MRNEMVSRKPSTRTGRRVLALLLACLMTFTLLPTASAGAAEGVEGEEPVTITALDPLEEPAPDPDPDSGTEPDSGTQPDQCVCETQCTDGQIDPNCPVCSADGADLSLCTGAPPVRRGTLRANAAGNTIEVDGSTKTLAAAVKDANSGDTLKITADFTLAEYTRIDAKSLTLDLNGKTITCSEYAIMLYDNASLTVTDSSGGGKLEAIGQYNNAIRNITAGTVTVTGGTVSATDSYAIQNEQGGAVTVSGGTVSATGSGGKAIHNNSTGTVTVTGGTVSAAGPGGYAIHNYKDGAVNVSGGTVETTASEGRAIYNKAGGTVTVTGGTVKATSEASCAIFNNSTGEVNVSGGTVSAENSPSGVAIYNYSTGKVTISGSAVVTSVNTAGRQGTICLISAPNPAATVLEIKENAQVTNTATTEGFSVFFAAIKVVTADNVKQYYTADSTATVGRVYPTAVERLNGDKIQGRYATLADAISEASTGDTLKIVTPIDLGANGVTISSKSLTLDLNGSRITYSGITGAIKLENGASLTVTDGSSSGGKLEATGEQGVAIYSSSAGAVNVSGGTVSATGTTGRAIYNTSTGIVTVSGGTVSATGTEGIAIYNNSTGKVTVSGNAVVTSGNTTASFGTIQLSSVPSAATRILTITGAATVTNTADTGYSVYFGGLVTSANVDQYYAAEATATVGKVYPTPHAHNWSTDWASDSTNHWHNCTASDCPIKDNSGKSGYEAHRWTAATCTTAKTCSVCGRTEGYVTNHDLTYSDSENIITEHCSQCGHTATATISAMGKVYDGTPVTVSITYSDGWMGGENWTATISPNNALAGNHTATFSIAGVTASVTFTITQAENSISGLHCGDVVFGGTPNPGASAAFGGDTIQYMYSNSRDGSYAGWSPSNGVGTWYVKATVPGTLDYAEATATASFQVTPASMTGVSAAGYEDVYDGESHGITVTGVAEGATVSYSLTDGSGWSATHPEIKDVTAGTTVYYKVSKDNYADTTGSATVRIDPKEVALSWTGTGETTYNGQPRNVTATATGLVKGDTCTVTVTGGDKTNAGTYTASAIELSNNNYKLPASGKEQSYTIAKAPLTVGVRDNLTISKAYDGGTGVEAGDVTDGLVVNGLQNGETASASGTWVYADTHAGADKTVNVTGVSITYGNADSGNYSFTAEPLTTNGTITRKPITPTIALEGDSWTYTGLAVTPGYTVKDGTTPLTADDYTVEFSDNVDAGTNTGKLTVIAKESGNYSFTDAEKTFTIAPKEIAAVWDSVTGWEYDGATHAPTATATGVDGETVTLAVTGGQKNYSAGDYTATASISSVTGGQARVGNYILTNTTQNFTISQKEVGLTWSVPANMVYTGQPVSVTATATELVKGDTCTVTVTGGGETDAGTYTASAIGLSNNNYKLPASGTEQSYTIAKAPLSFTVTNYEYDYNASAKSATVEQTEGETPSAAEQFTVSYKQGQDTVAQPTSVGEYEIWVTLTSGNFKFGGEQDATRSKQLGTLTIHGSAYPEQEKITWPTAGELTYGDPLSASTLTGGSTASAGGNGAFAWKEPGTIPTVTNDRYVVVFTPDDTNYFPVERTVSIAVTPKELTVSGAAATDRDFVPEDTAVTVLGGTLEGVVSRSGVSDEVTLDAGNAAGTVETPDAGNGKAVTVTGYAITGADAGNYTLKQPDGVTVNITPTQGSAAVTMDGWIYGEQAKSAAPVSDTNGTEHVSYQYTGTKLDGSDYNSQSVPTDAGTYTVTATFAGTLNYKESTATAEFTIDPKPVMVQWLDTTRHYDGTAKSPRLALVDVEESDRNNVSAALSGDGKTGAGSYPVTAALTGTRAFNYRITNPSGTLLIQKAPVVFTVSDDTVEHDGTAKTVTVTAIANKADFTSFTISYQNSAGKVVTAPTEAGSYEIWAELTNENYRHADSTGGERRKIGVFTIYQTTPPAKYTVSFAPGQGESITGSTAALDEALAGTLRVLPACGFAREGCAFTGWKLNGLLYQPGETIEQPAQNLTFSAEWIEVVHEIGGMVDQNGSPVENAVVTLMRGSRYVAETITEQDGKFTFSGVAPGLYNLVGSYNGVVMTIMVVVETEDVTGAEIHLPKGKTNSVVEVLAGTPEVVVGNLETTFSEGNTQVYTSTDKEVVQSGGTVEIKLTAQAAAANDTDEKQAAIEEKARNVGLYLELSLEKMVTTGAGEITASTLPTSGTVLLESVVPLPADLQGKYRYTVHRLHDPDGNGPEQPTLDTLTETSNEAGEHIKVSEDKTVLTIYARDYSLYAIAWENSPSSDSNIYPPIVTDTEHGTVEVSPERPSNGQEVVITPRPDEGYTAGTVTVTDKNGKDIPVKDNGDGTYSYTQPKGKVTVTVTFKPKETRLPWNPFTDVAERDWFHDSVKYVYEQSLMVGTSNTTFSPYMDTSRGMIVTILWRLEGEPEATAASSFSDVAAGAYYAKAVAWGNENGIALGYGNGRFGSDDTITREQLAAILHRYAQYKGADVGAGGALSAFNDGAEVSGYAREAMAWSVEQGIITGKDGGILDPKGTATRAEAAAMLMRYLQN